MSVSRAPFKVIALWAIIVLQSLSVSPVLLAAEKDKGWDDLSSGQHSIRKLGSTFSVPLKVKDVPEARLVLFNELVAKQLGLDIPSDPKELEKLILSKFAVMIDKTGDREMFATYYQDSNSRMIGEARGDGRAAWSGELVRTTPDGKKIYVDAVLKGVGQTPLAWTRHNDPGHKDGLQSMEEAIHSFIMSEINLRNGLDTTMDLAVIELPIEKVDKHSGEKRKTALTVRVGNQTRIAHYRYFSTEKEKFPQIADYIIARDLGLEPGTPITQDHVDKYLNNFVSNIAEEAARYLDLNAVHSSPTAGNRTTKGTTIDLGTFRYLDANHKNYTYLFDQLKLDDQTEQMKDYVGDIATYMNKAEYKFAPTKERRAELLLAFDDKYENELTKLWLERLGIPESAQDRIPENIKEKFFDRVNKMAFKNGKGKKDVGKREITPAAYDLRKILSEGLHAVDGKVAEEEQFAALEKLFLTDRSWGTLTKEDVASNVKSLHGILKSILKNANPSDAELAEWKKNASRLNTHERTEPGTEWVKINERPIVDKMANGAGFIELTNDAHRAVETLLDPGIAVRKNSNLGDKPKVGIFSGTFDPPHLDHLALIKEAIANLGLDKIYVVPNVLTEHKPGALSYEHRKKMLELLLADVPQAVVSDEKIENAFKEKDMEGVLNLVKRRNQKALLFHIMGTDSFERYQGVAPHNPNRTQIVLNPRDKDGIPVDLTKQIPLIKLPYTESTSSTKIREEIRQGDKPKDLSGPVYNYIKVHGLYERDCRDALGKLAKG